MVLEETSVLAAPAHAISDADCAAWTRALAPYARPSMHRSISCLASSVAPYLALLVAMYFALSVSVLLTLAIGVLSAGFLLRTYIVFHDCAHGSFLPSKRANIWLGSVLGVMVYAPFHNWRHNHAVHHATASDLDRRGQGDVPTLTVAEYHARDWQGRLGYRLFRNPVVMFGLGPLFAMVLGPRLMPKTPRPRIRRSVHFTNASLAVLIAGGCVLVGWRDFLLIEGPAAMIAGSAGIFLFYVQHQFEEPSGSGATSGATQTRRCAAAPTSSYRGSSSGSPGTSGSITSTT